MAYLEYYGSQGLKPLGLSPGPVSLPQTGASDEPRSVGDVLADPTTPAWEWDGDWVDATLLNGWTNGGSGGGYAPASYRKNAAGLVSVRGMVTGGSSSVATIFTLPEGYRPDYTLLFTGNSNNAPARLDLNKWGSLYGQSGVQNTTWVSFAFSFWAAW